MGRKAPWLVHDKEHFVLIQNLQGNIGRSQVVDLARPRFLQDDCHPRLKRERWLLDGSIDKDQSGIHDLHQSGSAVLWKHPGKILIQSILSINDEFHIRLYRALVRYPRFFPACDTHSPKRCVT